MFLSRTLSGRGASCRLIERAENPDQRLVWDCQPLDAPVTSAHLPTTLSMSFSGGFSAPFALLANVKFCVHSDNAAMTPVVAPVQFLYEPYPIFSPQITRGQSAAKQPSMGYKPDRLCSRL